VEITFLSILPQFVENRKCFHTLVVS